MCRSTPRAQCELPATSAAPRIGRAFLASTVCARHALSGFDEVALLTSEAITNAVLHGLPPLSLTVECRTSVIEVRVRDRSPQPPVGREATLDAEGGRGIALVDVLSEEWGVEATPDGKEVWFTVAR